MLAAELSGDPAVRQAFRDGRDLHQVTASAITGAAEEFGRKLVAAISPVTSRLHGDLMPCAQKSGRTSCSAPNLLGLPPEARRAVIAPSGKDVMPEQRKAAKPVNFGVLYGQGTRGLRATAWSDYGLDLSLAEAERARAALRARYPTLIAWQRRAVDRASAAGVLRSVLGRPLRAEWEPGGQIRYMLACNYPVQSSAADVLLVAMAKAASMLEGIDGALILQVHDELVVEAAEEVAPTARDRLVEAMTRLRPSWRCFPARRPLAWSTRRSGRAGRRRKADGRAARDRRPR